MKILLIEPFMTGSHAAWAKGVAAHSSNDVTILSLPGRHWKWRMHGGAVTLAQKFLAPEIAAPDLLLFTDMLDVTTFLALTRTKSQGIPTAIYFHENQICYPWSPADSDPGEGRDQHYAFVNYTSALACDRVFFNSGYHMESFYQALQGFLRRFPDFRNADSVPTLRQKSAVLHLGLGLSQLTPYREPRSTEPPLVLWNHRWEYDKNPGEFFRLLDQLCARGVNFEVALLGENFNRWPPEFDAARRRLGARVLHFGYAAGLENYARWLWRATVLPVTSNQDFFGASVIEAAHCEVLPLLPKRLSYPELFSKHREHIFYDDFADLVDRVAMVLETPQGVPSREIAGELRRFDWTHCVSRYDQAFADVLRSA